MNLWLERIGNTILRYGNEYNNEDLQGHFNEIHKYFNDYVQYHKEKHITYFNN